MPKGIRGYRWIETGRRVWQLEDNQPRHFIGCVSEISDGIWSWSLGFGGRESGESDTRRQAMDEVEKRRIKR